MHALLTFAFACTGFGLAGWGWVRHLRNRRRARRGETVSAWSSRLALLIGVPLWVAPDVVAGAIVAGGDGGAWATFFGLLYRAAVLGLLAIMGLVAFLSSDAVLDPIHQVRAKAMRLLPDPQSKTSRDVRKTAGGEELPYDFAGLMTHEAELHERLMVYLRDPEAVAARPAMGQMGNPLTQRAYQAMFAAEALRPQGRLPAVRDAALTDYGRAVVELTVAFRAAESAAEPSAADRRHSGSP